jgi:hypothetical protein
MFRRVAVLLVVGATLSFGLTLVGNAHTVRVPIPRSKRGADTYKETFCTSDAPTCLDPYSSIGADGEYTGHDEPSLIAYSHDHGSGNNMTYTITLPKEPAKIPQQNGKGGTWNFQLRPTFWLGLTMCDTQSAPEYTRTCQRDSDANNKVSTNPNSPNYLGRHPGNAFMELQFYGPGYVPQFEGFGCSATKYCAAMTIDSLMLDQNTGMFNNAACDNYFLAGPEPINWAYVTKNGVAQAPANPIAASTDPNLTAVTPNYAKDLLMSPGDRIKVHLHDTPAGFRTDLTDLTTGRSGFMTASKANGFGHILYRPNAKTCSVRPYAFHPAYDTAVARGTTWGAHTYNVAYSDEIGHFEFCNKLDANFNCKKEGANDPGGLDNDDVGCLPAADSSLIKVTSCTGSDNDFDGPSYLKDWPGTDPNVAMDRKFHPTSVLFTSPLSAGRDYPRVAFEADLPRIESSDNGGPGPFCDRTTGANCVNPPSGAQFYPFFSTRNVAGVCTWQEGGRYIPGTVKKFGGNSSSAFGSLLGVTYPEAGFTTATLINDFQRLLPNPCRRAS